jgi:hypothetical protein
MGHRLLHRTGEAAPPDGSVMSVRVMTAVFDYSEARGNDRLILLVIADRSNDDGTGCWRGKESIAHMARTSRATVTRSIARLEEIGELVVFHRPGATSQYQIVLPGVGSRCADLPPREAQSEPTGRLIGEPGVGSPVSRDTSISIHEPSKDLAPAKRTRQRDPIWDALIDCWAIDESELGTAERGRINQAASVLRHIDANPDEIPARRAMYAILFPDAAQTMMALVNRWAECRPDPARIPARAGRATGTIARAAARAER